MPVDKEKKQRSFDKDDRKDRKDFKRKKRTCQFCAKNAETISYKDEKTLRKYISERGKILPRRMTGTCAKHQREVVNAVNRARHVGILPYVIK